MLTPSEHWWVLEELCQKIVSGSDRRRAGIELVMSKMGTESRHGSSCQAFVILDQLYPSEGFMGLPN